MFICITFVGFYTRVITGFIIGFILEIIKIVKTQSSTFLRIFDTLFVFYIGSSLVSTRGRSSSLYIIIFLSNIYTSIIYSLIFLFGQIDTIVNTISEKQSIVTRTVISSLSTSRVNKSTSIGSPISGSETCLYRG